MAPVLGKRKASVLETKETQEDAADVFRRHFEAQFKPLKTEQFRRVDQLEEPEDDETSDEDMDEWDGLSEDEDDDEEDTTPTVEVVDHSHSTPQTAAVMSKRELKEFMVRTPRSPSRRLPLSDLPRSLRGHHQQTKSARRQRHRRSPTRTRTRNGP